MELEYPRGASYGKENDAEYVVGERRIKEGLQSFMMSFVQDGHYIHEVDLPIPGEFNMMNAAAAIAAAMELGVPFEMCQQSLANFHGIWRRFERVGTFQGAEVVSDYGHHPTAIKGTIESAREFFPDKRVVLCFEPHQHNRTNELFDRFVDVIGLADQTIVTEIYDVAGRNEDHDVSSKDLVKAVAQSHVVYVSDHVQAEEKLKEILTKDDVLVVMGAGDIDNLARKLVNL